MTDNTVLVIRPAKEREGSLRTLLRSGATIAVADHPGNDYVGFADRFIPLPVLPSAVRDGRTAEIESRLAVAHDAHPFSAIITHYDYLLPLVGRLNEKWGLRGHTEASGTNCSDKRAQRAALDAAGVPGPRWLVCTSVGVADAVKAVGLPAVVKPADRAASCAVAVVHNEAELAAAIEVATSESWSGVAIVEEYLNGPEFSVEGMVVAGEVHTLVVTAKGIGGRTGVLETDGEMPAPIDPVTYREIADTAADAVHATGLADGPTHTEVRVTPSGPRIVEVNGRVGGLFLGEMIKATTGIDVYSAWISVLMGAVPDLEPRLSRVACFRAYTEQSGVVGSVEVGRLAPALLERLLTFRSFVAAGQELRPIENGNETRALVASCADTAEEARRALDALQDALQILISEPAEPGGRDQS